MEPTFLIWNKVNYAVNSCQDCLMEDRLFIFGLIFGTPILTLLAITATRFVLAYIYFWLLNRFWGSFLYWVVLIGGCIIGLI